MTTESTLPPWRLSTIPDRTDEVSVEPSCSLGPRAVTRSGVTWRVTAQPNPNDWDFWGVWEDGWEQPTLDVVDRFARPDAVLLDVGAWIGPITLWAARSGPVVALEPDPIALPHLRYNCATNAAHKVEIIEGALATHSGTAMISGSTEGLGQSTSRVTPEGLPVRALTILEVFAEAMITSCSLVKMDVEGAEAWLLPIVAPFLARRKIPLLVSFHLPLWKDHSFDPECLYGYGEIETIVGGEYGQHLALP